jgi:hypothetical protein
MKGMKSIWSHAYKWKDSEATLKTARSCAQDDFVREYLSPLPIWSRRQQYRDVGKFLRIAKAVLISVKV